MTSESAVNRLSASILFGFSCLTVTLAGAFPSTASIGAAAATTTLSAAATYQWRAEADSSSNVEALATDGGSE